MPRKKPVTDDSQIGHYGFQNFNLVRRISRELFVNGYRVYRDYIDINQSTFYNRMSLIYNCLSACMEWPDNGYKWISYNKVRIAENPLYNLFKTRPMKTAFQYALHYALLDLLSDGSEYSLSQIMHSLSEDYEITYDIEQKNKLFLRLKNYYMTNGLIEKTSDNLYRKSQYSIPFISGENKLTDLIPCLNDAISFYSIYSPLGVIGSFIMDCYKINNNCFSFKHVFLSQSLDSQVIKRILFAINYKSPVKIIVEQESDTVKDVECFFPLKLLSSTISAKQYVYGFDYIKKELKTIRIDYVEKILFVNSSSNSTLILPDEILINADQVLLHTWGTVIKRWNYHVSITFVFKKKYQYNQLVKEQRNGKLYLINRNSAIFEADISDPKEMIPWLLSHISMVAKINVSGGKRQSDNMKLRNRFEKHIKDLHMIYSNSAYPMLDKKHRYSPIKKSKSAKLNNGGDLYDVFDPVFSNNIIQIDKILKSTVKPKTKDEIQRIIKLNDNKGGLDNESVLSFETMLNLGMLKENGTTKDGKTPLYSSYLKCNNIDNPNKTHRPLTKIEASWIKTILLDEKMKLFLNDNEINYAIALFSDIPTLYSSQDIKFYDQHYVKEDGISDLFVEVFRKIVYAINKRNVTLDIKYRTESEKFNNKKGHQYEIYPLKIEYSRLNDSFWLQSIIIKSPPIAPIVQRESSLTTLRISNIESIRICTDNRFPNSSYNYDDILKKEQCNSPIVLKLNDYGNAFERFMMEFSPYRKETVYDSNSNTCMVKIWYGKMDKNDLFLKIRSFGCAVKILSPKSLRLDMIKRIECQMQLLSLM